MNTEVSTRSRVRPKLPMYSTILDRAVATSSWEKTQRKRDRAFTGAGTRPPSLRQSPRARRIRARLMATMPHISKKPRRAYSATVKSLGSRPRKASVK